MSIVDPLFVAESLYLDVRDLADRVELDEARGTAEPAIAADLAHAVAELRSVLTAIDPVHLVGWDVRGYAAMRGWLDENHPADSAASPARNAGDEFRRTGNQIVERYATAQGAVDVDGETLTRLGVLGRLAIEPDADRRRSLFLALEPVWRSIDGDGVDASPYRDLLQLSAARWRAGRSPVEANARALGLDPAGIETSLVEILETWRAASVRSGGIEPWDWWYAAGAADRALAGAVPIERLRPVSDAYHAALGADPAELGVGFDVFPRPERPPVPVAYTTFGRRPRHHPSGDWSPAQPWVLGTYTRGGLGELTELVHETGHAIHIAGIRTRPALADWPDSDAFTEALAELTALDTAEPDWQQRWLGTSVPETDSLRGRYADVMLDVCWALLEIRLHADPGRRPNEVWTELTSGYLGIEAYPDWSWWAMRGQLVQEPGYMVNYALAAILAADMRAAIRAGRGPWTLGDPGWYPWVSERLYRWGLELTSGEVLRSFLGRPPSAAALLAEIGRVR